MAKKSIIGVNFLIYCPCYEQIIKWRHLGPKLRYMWKFGQSVPKQFNRNFEQIFNEQFGQKIHNKGQFSHLLSMLWTNYQNDVILGPKRRYMSKFWQNVKNKLWQKNCIVILNNFFNKQFGQKSIIGSIFSSIVHVMNKSSKWRHVWGQNDTICQNLDKV